MATSKRDVELAFRVKTEGGDSVGKLAGDLTDVGVAGKGMQAGVSGGAAALDDLAAATRGYRAAEASVAAEVREATQARDRLGDSLRRLKATYREAGTDTSAFRQEESRLKLEIIDANAVLRQKREALVSAASAARTAAAAEKNLADQVRATGTEQAAASKKASDGLQGIGAQLTQLRAVAAAALGGQLLGGLAGEISRTADEYQNLAGRVRQATGEGTAFDQAFQGVFDVAQRTNTAVETTGALFTKIVQAGKTLGVGVQDALRLTETINQAVQVSGASADSSNAAIIQLVQGLQSGVLRGDEFNSVMEQAPRLALALADGLGVTTGELRKMAEAGKLTSGTVIAALQGQSAALQAEFDKLPATAGRAITNLSSAWTNYVGEVDKAHGVSAAAAGAINALARNLDTLGTVLVSAGKAAAAYKALELAKLFLGHASAIAAETTATSANTAATSANTAAKRANAIATADAGGSATANVGRLAGALASLKMVALVGVLTNLREIGTAIGEGVAKWTGYGKAIERAEAAAKQEEETTRANAAAKAALAQKMQLAADRTLGLTAESKKLVDEFEGLRLKGESTAEALEKLTKNLRIGDISGIATAGAALDALALKGELSADQVRDSWVRALRTIDLGVFAGEARAAFDGSEQGARRLASAMDGALREAIRRSGLDFQLISGGMSSAAQSALNDLELIVSGLDKLKASGSETGQLLAASLTKAINNADSQRAIDAVKMQIEGLRNLLGDKIADGFLDQAAQKALELKDSIDKALPGINSIREAYKQLGVQAPEDLTRVAAANKSAWEMIKNDGTTNTDVLRAAFSRYAQSALDASGAAGSASRETTQALLGTEAAAKGLGVTFDEAGRIIVRGAFEAADAIRKTAGAVDETTAAIGRQIVALQTLHDKYRTVGQDANKTADGFTKNPDGSAAGTFNNMLPMDQADRLVRTQGAGMSPEEIDIAIQQAQNVFQYMQAMDTLNPGMNSFAFTQSATAMMNAANVAKSKRDANAIGTTRAPAAPGTSPVAPDTVPPAPAPGIAPPGGGSRTVNINIGGRQTAVNVASQQDSDALVGVLRNLENQQGTAA